MKSFCLTAICLLIFYSINAQTLNYQFEPTSNDLNPHSKIWLSATSSSSSSLDGFLPGIFGGSFGTNVVKVNKAGLHGNFELVNYTESGFPQILSQALKIIPSESSTPNEFVVSNVPQPTDASDEPLAISVLAGFKRLSGSSSSVFSFSMGTGSVFSEKNTFVQLTFKIPTSGSTLQFEMKESGNNDDDDDDDALVSIKNPLNLPVFILNASYNIEIYANNNGGTTNKQYTKNGITRTLGSGQYQIWINSELMAENSSDSTFTISKKSGLRDKDLNLFTARAFNNTGNNTAVYIDRLIVGTNLDAISNSVAMLLPVMLISFSARPLPNKSVVLNWSTSSETVNKGFRIERQSENGSGKFENVGFVPSKANGGNSQVALNYNFVDLNPRSDATSYYRLVQEDLDGKAAFTEVRVVKLSGQTLSMVYPNPSNGAVNISKSADGRKMNVQVMDMSGRVIQQFSNIIDANYRFNITKTGIYNIKLIYPETGEQSIQRVVIER